MSDSVIPTSPIKLIWQPELCEQLNRSRYTIERWVRQGTFPKPIKIHSQGNAWRVVDIELWLDRLSRSRRKPKRRGALMEGDVLVERTKKRVAADA